MKIVPKTKIFFVEFRRKLFILPSLSRRFSFKERNRKKGWWRVKKIVEIDNKVE